MSPPPAKPLPRSIFSSSSTPPPPLYTLLFLLLLIILGFYALHRQATTSTATGVSKSLCLAEKFLSLSTNATISSYLRHLTSHQHLAGTPASEETSDYVYSHFKTLGLNPQIVPYTVLLSYPIASSLSVHFPNGTSAVPITVTDDENGAVVMPYHAYSPSGGAVAEPVYVNHGSEEDYRALDALGVSVKGRVVLVRKGGGELSRGATVRIAAGQGAAAAVLFGGGSGVERGTVINGMGDPLSPGWAAVEGGERFEEKQVSAEKFPMIPSIPISSQAANVILGSLGGPAVPTEWGIGTPGQRVGPGPTLVNLTFLGEKKEARIQNVFAVIRGFEEPDRYVIMGNHRDAWTYGAVDPNSGTAALLDIARRFSNMLRNGWRPRRTILLSSWDGEEFGMVGSTEWVEQNLVNLRGKAVAYLNVDCAVQGAGFNAASTPQLDNLLFEVTRKVKDPDVVGAMLYDKWASMNQATSIERLSGAFSDFAPFLQHGGIPSADIYYGKDFPVYHTAFDSYDWVVKHADPLFHRHVAVADVWGLVALRLADDPILPFNYLSYAQQLSKYKEELSILVDKRISLHPLVSAIEQLASAAEEAEIEAKVLRKQDGSDGLTALKQRAFNDRLMLAERGFLDADGLQGRHWFKHLIYGPHGDYQSKLDFFPGIADAIHKNPSQPRQEGAVQHEVWRVSRAIQGAANALRGQILP